MKILSFMMVFLLFVSCGYKHQYKPKKIPKADTIPTLTEAYRYGFPIVLMDLMRETQTNTESPIPELNSAPTNQFVHLKNNPKSIIHQSKAWLDLTHGPLIIEVPTTNDDYYTMLLMSAWTNVYASPGKRTTGTLSKKFMLAGPKWDGDLLPNTDFIRSPTNLTLLNLYLESASMKESAKITRLQNSFKIYPMQFIDKNYSPPLGIINPNLELETPLKKLLSMNIVEFYNRLNKLLVLNPPAPEDDLAMDQFQQVSISAGSVFDLNRFSVIDQNQIINIPKLVHQELEEMKNSLALNNGWLNMRESGDDGVNFQKRALNAYLGSYGTYDKDLIHYSATKDYNNLELDGEKTYVLHFDAKDLPSTNAFWNLSIVDQLSPTESQTVFSSISSLSKLKYNQDGSLDVYLQNSAPKTSHRSNWIQIPKNKFNVSADIFWPKDEVLDPNWKMPPILLQRNFKDRLSMNDKE